MANLAYLDKVRNAAEDAYGHARGLRDETEKKVFEALNNKNWGASSTTLNDISQETYSYDKFQKIFKLIWEAADSPPRNWRKVFKALMLCEYLVKNGCERCVDEIRDHSFRVRQLQDFNYYEEKLDRGQGVREKAKQLVELLADSGLIRDARENAKRLRDKFVGHGPGNEFSGRQGSGLSYGASSGIHNSKRYSDKCGYLDSAIPADAPGRYNAESNPETFEPAPLRIKAKTKTVPRIKMKCDTQKKKLARLPIMHSELAGENSSNLFEMTTTGVSPESDDVFGAFSTQPLAQDTTFDPRGGKESIQTHPVSSVQASCPFHVQPPCIVSTPTQMMPPQQPHLVQVPLQHTIVKTPEQLSFGNFAVAQAPELDDFGDFDACPQVVATLATMPITMPIDTVGSLCSLDSLSLNASAAPPPPPPIRGPGGAPSLNGAGKQAYAQHAAFTGLDSFSTAPQPMRPAIIPPATYCQTPIPYDLHIIQTPVGQLVSNSQQLNSSMIGQPQSSSSQSNYPS